MHARDGERAPAQPTLWVDEAVMECDKLFQTLSVEAAVKTLEKPLLLLAV